MENEEVTTLENIMREIKAYNKSNTGNYKKAEENIFNLIKKFLDNKTKQSDFDEIIDESGLKAFLDKMYENRTSGFFSFLLWSGFKSTYRKIKDHNDLSAMLKTFEEANLSDKSSMKPTNVTNLEKVFGFMLNPDEEANQILEDFVTTFNSKIESTVKEYQGLQYQSKYQLECLLIPQKISEINKYLADIEKDDKHKAKIIQKSGQYTLAKKIINEVLNTGNKMISEYYQAIKNKTRSDMVKSLKSFNFNIEQELNIEQEQNNKINVDQVNEIIKIIKFCLINFYSGYYQRLKELIKSLIGEKSSIFKFLETKRIMLKELNTWESDMKEIINKLEVKKGSAFGMAEEILKDIAKYESQIKEIEDNKVKNKNWLTDSCNKLLDWQNWRNLTEPKYEKKLINHFGEFKFEYFRKNQSNDDVLKMKNVLRMEDKDEDYVNNFFDKVYKVSGRHTKFLGIFNGQKSDTIDKYIELFNKAIKEVWAIYPMENKPKIEDPDDIIKFFADKSVDYI